MSLRFIWRRLASCLRRFERIVKVGYNILHTVTILHTKIVFAPIAQWIERLPPEQETCVRVAVGVQGILEPPETDLERFFSMIRFESREKLKDLPDFQLDA